MLNPSEAHRRLYTQAQGSPERTLAVRAGVVLGLMLFVVALFLWDRDGLRDQIDGHVSVLDVVYFVSITITTVGYGDIVPVSDQARLLDTVIITPIRLIIWFIFLGTAYQLVVQRALEDYRLTRLQKQLNNHIIICGFGHSGRTAAAEIIASGHPAGEVMVVDTDPETLQAAAEEGFLGLLGDSTLQKTLSEAGAARARAVIVCVERDDTAVLTVLTIRQFTTSAKVICSVKEEENADLIRQAGADVVVVPARVSGYLLADAVEHAHVSDYVSDLLTRGGRVRLTERTATPEEVGKRLRDLSPGLGVRIHRGKETIGFWEDGEKSAIMAGDTLLVINADDGENGG